MLTYPFEFRWERERWIWERIFYRKERMRMRDGEGAEVVQGEGVVIGMGIKGRNRG